MRHRRGSDSYRNPFQDSFLQWPGFMRDRRLDIAVVRRDVSFALADIVPQSESSPVCPDVTDIQSCIEHTVTSGVNGRQHNKQHAYAKITAVCTCLFALTNAQNCHKNA